MKTRTKAILFRLIAVLFPLLLLFAAAEWHLRRRYAARDAYLLRCVKLLESGLYGSIGQPGDQGIDMCDEYAVSARSNREGFRDDEPVDGQRGGIALLGDSYVWGMGVEEHQRFGNLMRKRLRMRVLNYGSCFAGTINELAVFRDFCQWRQPDLVLLVFCPNDVQNNLWWIGRKDIPADKVKDQASLYAAMDVRARQKASWQDAPELVSPQIGLSACWYFVRERLRIIAGKRQQPKNRAAWELHENKRVDPGIIRGESHWGYALSSGSDENVQHAWDLTRTALSALKARTDRIHAELLLVYLPYQEAVHGEHWRCRKAHYNVHVPDERLDFDLPCAVLKEIAGDLAVRLVDLTPSMRENAKKTEGDLFYLIDGHLTVLGNRVVADVLAEYIGEHYPRLLDGPKPAED